MEKHIVYLEDDAGIREGLLLLIQDNFRLLGSIFG